MTFVITFGSQTLACNTNKLTLLDRGPEIQHSDYTGWEFYHIYYCLKMLSYQLEL